MYTITPLSLASRGRHARRLRSRFAGTSGGTTHGPEHENRHRPGCPVAGRRHLLEGHRQGAEAPTQDLRRVAEEVPADVGRGLSRGRDQSLRGDGQGSAHAAQCSDAQRGPEGGQQGQRDLAEVRGGQLRPGRGHGRGHGGGHVRQPERGDSPAALPAGGRGAGGDQSGPRRGWPAAGHGLRVHASLEGGGGIAAAEARADQGVLRSRRQLDRAAGGRRR
jgi:hypothetical protein